MEGFTSENQGSSWPRILQIGCPDITSINESSRWTSKCCQTLCLATCSLAQGRLLGGRGKGVIVLMGRAGHVQRCTAANRCHGVLTYEMLKRIEWETSYLGYCQP